MAYIHTGTSQYPLSEQDIRNANPNTSFATPFSGTDKYKWVFPVAKPEYNPVIQTIEEGFPVLTNKGHYEEVWTVKELYTKKADKDKAIADFAEAERKRSVPLSVTPRQIRQALTATGLRNQVESTVATLDQDTKDWWDFATLFERNHPMVIAMATGLAVTELQLDELFVLAASL
jgi:hypothetical protein